MGSFDASCGVSHLPIEVGDKLYTIILMQNNQSTFGDYTILYPSDHWIPIGIPILSEYADYGQSDSLDFYAEDLTFAFLNTFDQTKAKFDSLRNFMENIREQSKNALTKTPLSYMFVREEVYNELVTRFGTKRDEKRVQKLIEDYATLPKDFSIIRAWEYDMKRAFHFVANWEHVYMPFVSELAEAGQDFTDIFRFDAFLVGCYVLQRPLVPMMTSGQEHDYKPHQEFNRFVARLAKEIEQAQRDRYDDEDYR
jgi:hypothetical protein